MIDVETTASMNPDVTIGSSQPVIQKRRSSIFQRRSINLRQQDYNESITEREEPTHSEILTPDEPREEVFDLSKYISSLLDEQRVWKKTLNERKSRRRCLVKEEARVRDGVEFDPNSLTDREKHFISERPNYESISENMQNLLKVAVKISTVNHQVNHMYTSLTETMKDEIVSTKTQLIDLSDV